MSMTHSQHAARPDDNSPAGPAPSASESTPDDEAKLQDNKAHARDSSANGTTDEDISLNEVVDTITDLIAAKKMQLSAQWELVAAEAKLLRQSVLVTALATLAAFAFGCVCWLILNATSAVMLAAYGIHPAVISLTLLAVNGALMWLAWRTAKQAFSHLTIAPVINACRGEPEMPRPTRNSQNTGDDSGK